jgi:hypothetical protein
MNNASDLRKELISLYNDLKSGKIDVKSAKALVSVSNCLLKSAAIEAEYNKFLNEKTEMEFLKTKKND